MKKVFLLCAALIISGAISIFGQAQSDSDSLKNIKLEEVVVSSTRAGKQAPMAYSNLSGEAIEKQNSGQDIPYILLLTPSVTSTSEAGSGIGYTGFRIRGTDANRINITVNGIPLNDSESHGVFFVNMPDFASSLSSIQVQRGVGTSTNGSAAFGASVNMQTENVSRQPFAEISSSYGSFNTNKNTMKAGTGLIGNHFAIEGRYSTINSDGYIDRASVNMRSYYLAAACFTENTVLKFITFGGKEKTYQAWNGVDLDLVRKDPVHYSRTYNELGQYTDDEGNTQYYNNQTDNYTQTHYQLHAVHQLSPELSLNAALHYTKGVGYYEEYKTGRVYAEYLLTPAVVNGVTLKKTDLVRQKWLDNHFYGATAALNYSANQFGLVFGGGANKYDGEHFGKVLWVRYPNHFDADKDWYRNSSVKTDANTYLKLHIEPVDNLFLYADAQYRYIKYDIDGKDDKYDGDTQAMRDITQQHTFSFFNPKAGATYRFDTKNEIYGSLSMANREPNRNNYTDAGPNDQPTAERLYDTEAGYRYQSGDAGFGLNLYYMKYKDQLILTGKISEIGEALTTNIPDSYRAGIELTGALKISPMLRWDGNVTFSRNKIKNFVEQDIDEYDADWNWTGSRSNDLGTTDISYSPNIIANSIVTFNYKGFETALMSHYVSRQYIDNTSDRDRSIPGYFVNNLRGSYSFKVPNVRAVELGIWVNNLFNAEYSCNGYNWYSYYLGGERVNEKRYFPQAGTNVQASMTLKF
ncbi:MAG: TonB-dependent receptor [Dysgonamonadaceae bacterium]|jgi:iron complex outermembrane receptor protein|nr:TonB-dependent receptor [Dysgonamonadaceae bacterium]